MMIHKIKKWMFWRGVAFKDMLIMFTLFSCLIGTISFFAYVLMFRTL